MTTSKRTALEFMYIYIYIYTHSDTSANEDNSFQNHIR